MLNQGSDKDINIKQKIIDNEENEYNGVQVDQLKQKVQQSPKKIMVKNPKKTFNRLLSYTLKYKGWLIVANLSLILSTIGMIYLPLLSGGMIDHIKEGLDLLEDSKLFIGLSLLMAIFSAIKGYSFGVLGENIVFDLRRQFFRELISKDISYYDQNKSGELLSRLTSDIEAIQGAASNDVSILLRNIIQFLGSLFFLCFISWKLTSFIMIMTPVIAFIALFIIKSLKKYKKDYQNHLAYANSSASQAFANIRVVKSFSNQNTEFKNYQNLLNQTYTAGIKQSQCLAIMLFVMIIFANILILSVLYFGGSLASKGQLTIGQLTSFVLYTITLTTGLTSLSGTGKSIASALGVCENVFAIIDEPILVIDGLKTPKLPQNSQTLIEFIDATFSYPTKPNVNVIEQLNLKVKKGQSLAIVGASGSGKSSILNLILRFYDLNEGKLKIGETDIKQISLDQLRRQIGFVSQQPTLFSGTLKENIQYGLKNHQKKYQKIIHALQISNAKEFVMNKDTFPDGLNTVVGERGVKLSGGQKQRIAIARSIIKDPKILIFDQATSALDSQSQNLVQTAIDKLVNSKQRTMIIVAHRLSTIIKCDRIIVLKDGKIVEQGTHKNLLQNKGVYSNLVEKQISSFH